MRQIFNAITGPAIGASIMYMGQRFRLVENVVDVVEFEHYLSNIPVARTLCQSRPNR